MDTSGQTRIHPFSTVTFREWLAIAERSVELNRIVAQLKLV